MNRISAGGALNRMAILGNHTPRQCGIATFTADLRAAIGNRFQGLDCLVLAMNDNNQSYAYPEWVRAEIDQEDPASYHRAAEALNGGAVDVLSLQHEYGIYGGAAGNLVLTLMREVRMPIVTTLHTILTQPDAQQRATMDEVIRLSERVVVMSAHGAELLGKVHGVSRRKIDLIPHGIPTVPFHSQNKNQLGLGGRLVILTFGLLAPDKGIESVIEAMPGILARFPLAVYVVLGATHPHVLAQDGETYRHKLEARAKDLGVDASIIFHNRFVSPSELTGFLAAADIYITPYLKMEQITSGTLAYAVGSGKAVISTPYLYAKELLANGRGILVPPQDSAAITREVVDLLGDDGKRLAMRHRAAEYGRAMAWPVVAGRYMDSFQRARVAYANRVAPRLPFWHASQLPLPEPGFQRLSPLPGAGGLGLQGSVSAGPQD